MSFKISFIVQDEADAQAFVNDSEITSGLIAYVTDSADQIELQTSDMKYEPV